MNSVVAIKPNERVDDLHRNGYRLIQDPDAFCFGVDAVLLSSFARVAKGEAALDLCTGTGIIPILLSARTEGRFFTGLEIQPNSVDMAMRSVALNGLTDKIEIICGDVKDPLLKPSAYDVVTANPPYMNNGGGLLNNRECMMIARHEILCTLGDVVSAAARYLRPGGRFYMIHRPHRITEVLSTLARSGLEPKRLRFVHPYADAEPTMFLVESVRGGRPMTKVMPPLIVYQSNGKYTEEVSEIYYGPSPE